MTIPTPGCAAAELTNASQPVRRKIAECLKALLIRNWWTFPM